MKKKAKVTNLINELVQLPVKRKGKLECICLMPKRSTLILQEELLPDAKTKQDMGMIRVEILN